MPGSGCDGAASLECVGQPRIGNRFTVSFPRCSTRRNGMSFLLIGLPGPSFVISPPVACGTASCTVACVPIAVYSHHESTFDVPNARSLVGHSLCAQGVCYVSVSDGAAVCIFLHRAITITLLP